MIYIAFTFWLFMILFTGLWIYRLWASLLRPRWVNWLLLPGTFVSEVGYIVGCLITGGEIKRAKILPNAGESSKDSETDGEPTTEDTPKFKFVGPLVASLLSLTLVFLAIVVLYSKLESPVIEDFITSITLNDLPRVTVKVLPKELPDSIAGFWNEVRDQVYILEGMGKTLRGLDWMNWRAGLFIYLTICLSVRLAPVGRDLRWVLAAMIALAAIIALIGAINSRFDDLIKDIQIWGLLTYIWTLLLLVLALTGLGHASVAFVKMLRAKGK